MADIENQIKEFAKSIGFDEVAITDAKPFLDDEKAALEDSREKQISKIDSSTIQIYSKVMSARSGIAVVPLSGDSCGGCGAALPIQMASEIRGGKSHTCFNCGRFVYGKKN